MKTSSNLEAYPYRVWNMLEQLTPNEPYDITKNVSPANRDKFIHACKRFMDANNTIGKFWEFSDDYCFIKLKVYEYEEKKIEKNQTKSV